MTPSVTAVAAATLLGLTSALKGSTSMPISPGSIRRLYEFGYNAGGSVTASWSLPPPSPDEGSRVVIAAVCTDAQVNTLLEQYGDPFHTVCRSGPGPGGLCWQSVNLTGGGVWSLPPTPAPEGTLSFIAISCYREATADVTLTYECVNAGGEQLSAGQIPLKPLTISFACMWALFGLAVVGGGVGAYGAYPPPSSSEAAQFRDFPGVAAAIASPIRPIHGAIFVCILLAGASASLSRVLWQSVSESGVFSLTLTGGDSSMWDVASASVVCLLLALSRGWQLTRLTLEPYEVRAIASLTLLYALSWTAWQWVGGFFALFALVLTYTLILRYMFYSLTYALKILGIFRAYTSTLLSAATPPPPRPSPFRAGGGVSGGEHSPSSSSSSLSGVGEVPRAYTAPPLPDSELQVDAATAALLATPAFGGWHSAHGRGAGAAGGEEEEEDGGREGVEKPTSRLLGRARQPRRPDSPYIAAARRAAAVASSAAITALDFVTGVNHRAPGEGEGEGGPRVSGAVREGGLTTRQLRLLRLLRSSCVVFLSADVFLSVWSDLDLGADPWVQFLVEHLASLLILTFLAWTMRPRGQPGESPLYDPRGYVSGTEDALQPLVGASGWGGRVGGRMPPRPPPSAPPKAGAGSGTSSDDASLPPRWLVIVGPDGEVRGAAGKADEVELVSPRVPALSPLSLPQLAGAHGFAADTDGWVGVEEALRLSMVQAGRER